MQLAMFKHNKNGFTLIELLIVVSIIGILTTVLLSVINPRRAQGSARDGVRMANIEKLAQALETYVAAEEKYPTLADLNNTHTPTTSDITNAVLKDYIKNWPEKSATGYEYKYYLDASGGFVISVKSDRGADSCVKYGSTAGQLYHCKVCDSPDVATCNGDPYPTN